MLTHQLINCTAHTTNSLLPLAIALYPSFTNKDNQLVDQGGSNSLPLNVILLTILKLRNLLIKMIVLFMNFEGGCIVN